MARVDNFEQRFGGIGRLYTPEGLAKLRQSHICVIGIGGRWALGRSKRWRVLVSEKLP